MADPQESAALQRPSGDGSVAQRQPKMAQRVTVPCDIYENDVEYLILADMPGLESDQCDLVVRGDRLEMHGERMIGDQQFVYERSFAMPQNADTKEISATYKDGVFRVTAAKTQESRPRKIAVHG